MKLRQNSITLATGLALFSMFFGAGNVTFPLIMGHKAGDQIYIALLGLCVTAVALPIFGVISSVLYRSDYNVFFARLGRWPGWMLLGVSMLLLGPLGAIPRSIIVAYSGLHFQIPTLSRALFGLFFCITSYVVAIKKSTLVDIIGVVLTPLLLLLIFLIVGVALLFPQPLPPTTVDGNVFLYGFREGYNTLDVVSSLFFSGVILASVVTHFGDDIKNNDRAIVRECVKAGIIGGGLLAAVYWGLSLTSAMYAQHLDVESLEASQLLAALTHQVLGQYASPVAAIVVFLACYTTAVPLTCIAADFISELHPAIARISYEMRVLIILAISFVLSMLGFANLMNFIAPLIVICYPVYIVLCMANFGHKMFGMQAVKLPAFVAFIASLGYYFFA